jgi:hypothetical protein
VHSGHTPPYLTAKNHKLKKGARFLPHFGQKEQTEYSNLPHPNRNFGAIFVKKQPKGKERGRR